MINNVHSPTKQNLPVLPHIYMNIGVCTFDYKHKELQWQTEIHLNSEG